MKKTIIVFLLFFIICISVCVSVVNAIEENLPSITVNKTENELTDMPILIQAKFDVGNKGSDYFVKRAYFRVDTLDDNADLTSVYQQNKDKAIMFSGNLNKYVTLNGTYLVCGWSADTEIPDYIERIDVNEIEIERPMGEVVFNLTGDFSKDIIATAEIRNLECADGAEIKRYMLAKWYPTPPEYHNKYYDENIVETHVSLDSDNKTVKITTPDNQFEKNKFYTLTITNDVKTNGGNSLESDFLYEFYVMEGE